MADRDYETNADIAGLLRDVGLAYGIKGRNRFETQAYERAAAGIGAAPRSVRELAAAGALREVPGIGQTIAGYLSELFTNGRVAHFDEVRADIPEAVFELVRVPGVGPATAMKLAEAGVEDLRDLDLKLAGGALSGALTAKALEKVAAGLAELQRRSGRLLLPVADASAADVLAFLRALPGVATSEVSGSVRRRAATVGNIDLVVAAADPADVLQRLRAYSGARAVLLHEATPAARLTLHSGVAVDVRAGAPPAHGTLLALSTGSALHIDALRALAGAGSLTIDGFALRGADGALLELPDEGAFYTALGLPPIPPELREGAGEVEAALAGTLPLLIDLPDIRADCHTHTAWSDGRDSLAQMAAACRALGREYMAITDHSYPNLNFAARSAELDALRASDPGIRLIDGLEVNITSEGGLQVPDEVLARHEYCIGSIHSSFRQPRDVMTRRLLAALAHPSINGIAHPTGRLLNSREGIDADWEAVMDACLRYDKFLEIDGSPERSDLPDLLVREAVRRGVKLVIDSDAHATENLTLLRYGVDVARRGWASAANILNTLPYGDFVREAHVRLR